MSVVKHEAELLGDEDEEDTKVWFVEVRNGMKNIDLVAISKIIQICIYRSKSSFLRF